eukprot:1160925-Pelagomonas_calceolata.AAC.2
MGIWRVIGSLSSLHQFRKQILYPEKHRHHVQGEVLKRVSNLACTSQDIISRHQASVRDNNLSERHNIASRMVLTVVSKGSYGSNLVRMDVGSAGHLARHDLHIIEQVSNRERQVYASQTVIYLPTSLTPVFLVKLDAPPAALTLS